MLLENKFEAKTCAEIAAMLSPLTCQYAYGGSKDTDFGVVFKHPVNELVSSHAWPVLATLQHLTAARRGGIRCNTYRPGSTTMRRSHVFRHG